MYVAFTDRQAPDQELDEFGVQRRRRRHHRGCVVAPHRATSSPTSRPTTTAARLFGPDGKLYIGTGDGGGAGDPDGNGQDLDDAARQDPAHRSDVSGAGPYAIPPGNPFVGLRRARREIWWYGLRNPWRFSFDRATHDM